jgi:hypothetical protein
MHRVGRSADRATPLLVNAFASRTAIPTCRDDTACNAM